MKIVLLDTNVIISGLFNPHGAPCKIFELAVNEKLEAVSSRHLIDELRRALAYERVTKLLARRGWTEAGFDDFCYWYSRICRLTSDAPPKEKICLDPDDDWLFTCAEEAGAENIISGDKKVNDVKEHKGIRVVTPKDFLEALDCSAGI
ncbi:MAG: putative toxin-antitoxin system toxin component, PIN family [Deltaproteobacteria bacterium]|nr:putative toxin-antitoxin system toxin component, PIN family [Deltaproteobacteria bacterium]